MTNDSNNNKKMAEVPSNVLMGENKVGAIQKAKDFSVKLLGGLKKNWKPFAAGAATGIAAKLIVDKICKPKNDVVIEQHDNGYTVYEEIPYYEDSNDDPYKEDDVVEVEDTSEYEEISE